MKTKEYISTLMKSWKREKKTIFFFSSFNPYKSIFIHLISVKKDWPALMDSKKDLDFSRENKVEEDSRPRIRF